VKQDFGNASILKDGRLVFNIAGNKYRLVVWINDDCRVVYVRYIGTHKQYDEMDAQTIEQRYGTLNHRWLQNSITPRVNDWMCSRRSLMPANPTLSHGINGLGRSDHI
jgi:hypothetical protein